MSTWKVVLAALVLFCTGFFAGVLFPRSSGGAGSVTKVTPPPLMPDGRRYEAIRRMTHDLNLSEDQLRRVEGRIRESQERTRVIWELVGPEVQEEFRRLRSEVAAELGPEQRRKFDANLRKTRRTERPHAEPADAPPEHPARPPGT